MDSLKSLLLHSPEEYHEDDGEVLWWLLPIAEAPYVGSPLDTQFPWDLENPPKHLYWTYLPEIWTTQKYKRLVKELA